MRLAILTAMVLGLSGCAVAELKKETPNGGRVHVMGYASQKDGGVKKAEEIISKKCPGGYEELERGTESAGARMGVGYGGSVDVPAFYIEFKCKDPSREAASK
jgi:hypothetical protein